MDYLKSFRSPIICQGTVYYDVNARVNNIVRLKKKILNAYGDLSKEKYLFYRVELYSSFDELLRRIQELKNENKAIPILLFLSK